MKIYHTETQADYDALMVELEGQGIETLKNRCWKVYDNQTVVFVRAIGRYGDSTRTDTTYGDVQRALYKYPDTPITKYKAKAEDKMKFTKENVKKVIDEYFQEADLESCGDLIAEIYNLDDTPKKVVVPKFVAEFYEECTNATLGFLITQLKESDYNEELGKWYRCCSGRHRNGRANAQEVIAKMKLYGYEVEKEPLYEVLLPRVRWNEERSELVTEYQKLLFDKTSEETRFVHRQYVPVNNDYTCKLAESDIKEIDERFWLFAVLAND